MLVARFLNIVQTWTSYLFQLLLQTSLCTWSAGIRSLTHGPHLVGLGFVVTRVNSEVVNATSMFG